MTTFWRVAAIATLAIAAGTCSAQAIEYQDGSPSASSETEETAAAVYASLSDTEGPSYEPIDFDQIGVETKPPQVAYLTDDPTAFVDSVESASLSLPTDVTSTSEGEWIQGGYELPTSDSLIAAPGCGAVGSCDDGCGCQGGGLPCGSLCDRNCPCCCGVGTHYSGFYGEFLYLRARGAEVTYAVPIDGPIVAPPNNPLQLGSYTVADPDYSPGFRAGFTAALDTVSSLDIRYTYFESLTNSATKTDPPLVLRSLVSHPSSDSAATDFLSATVELEIDFDVIDATYRHALVCKELFAADFVIGGRYAKLEQQFSSEFFALGSERVRTDIDFEGGGLRLGLETQRYSCRNQLHVYARGYANFVAGRFTGSYFQGQSFDPTVVSTEWEAGRVVPILDLELGAGWTSPSGKVRLAGGYMVNAWFNTLTTQEFIHAVQGSDLVDLGQTMTFDGLNARVEYRF